MKSEKNSQKPDGFVVLLLDILFVAAGIILLISALLSNKDILSAMLGR